MASKRTSEEEAPTAAATTTTAQKGKNKRRKKKSSSKHTKKNHIKDPKEAHDYLSSWKNKDQIPGVWKFNKNTQSWLIRKMYNVEMIPKTTFGILMEYLEGLNGNDTIDRIYQDTTRRILRYKDWEKNCSANDDDNGDNDGDNEKDVDVDADTNDNTNDDDDEEENDEDRFKKMSSHDKRKEYKRARKVHDVLKALLEQS